jgi:hypothetical protein
MTLDQVHISALEHSVYCPRQCALIHVDKVWVENKHTVRDQHGQRRTETPGTTQGGGQVVLRAVQLYSEFFGLIGRPSLALDRVEEFRSPIADCFIVSCLTRHQIGPENFASAGNAWYLSDEGRKKLIGLYEAHRSEQVRHPLLNEDVPRSLLPNIQATLLARHIRGDIPSYPPYLLER